MTKLILLTGGKGSGKDTFAQLAQDILPGQVVTAAIADWFKRVLAHATGLELQSFYDHNKDVPFEIPLIVDERLIPRLGLAVTTVLNSLGIPYEHDKLYTTLDQYRGKDIGSRRRLMEWFGFDFIHEVFGTDEIHCLILMRSLLKTMGAPRFVIITDARTYYESGWFSQRWTHGDVVTVKIVNPRVEQGTSAVEKATNLFPAGWFGHVIENPYPNLAMYRSIVEKVVTS